MPDNTQPPLPAMAKAIRPYKRVGKRQRERQQRRQNQTESKRMRGDGDVHVNEGGFYLSNCSNVTLTFSK